MHAWLTAGPVPTFELRGVWRSRVSLHLAILHAAVYVEVGGTLDTLMAGERASRPICLITCGLAARPGHPRQSTRHRSCPGTTRRAALDGGATPLGPAAAARRANNSAPARRAAGGKKGAAKRDAADKPAAKETTKKAKKSSGTPAEEAAVVAAATDVEMAEAEVVGSGRQAAQVRLSHSAVVRNNYLEDIPPLPLHCLSIPRATAHPPVSLPPSRYCLSRQFRPHAPTLLPLPLPPLQNISYKDKQGRVRLEGKADLVEVKEQQRCDTEKEAADQV